MPIRTHSTVRRHFRNAGLSRQPRDLRRDTEGTRRAAERKEVRSFEIEQGHGHWHLDDHHGSRQILSSDGQVNKPVLLAILDDRSRLIYHLQSYLDETTEPRKFHLILPNEQKRYNLYS